MAKIKSVHLNKFIVLLVVAVVFLGAITIVMKNSLRAPNFSAVYLRTGDIYFGKLVNFPSFGLKQVYTLQVNPQSQEAPINIQRFTSVFWGPQDFLKINRDQVVWVTNLDEAGDLAKLIKVNPNLLAPQQVQTPSSFEGPATQPPVEEKE